MPAEAGGGGATCQSWKARTGLRSRAPASRSRRMASKTPPGDDRGESHARPLHAPYIVLVGLDLSEPGGRAWRFAFELARLKGEDSEVHAVVIGARAMAPRIRDLATPGVSTPPRAEEAARLPPLKVLE